MYLLWVQLSHHICVHIYIYIYVYIFSSVQFSRSVVSNSLWPHGLQHTRPPYLSPTPRVMHWIGDAIQPIHPLLSPSPPALNLSQHQGLFKWVSTTQSGGQSIGVSASALVLPLNIQNWFPWGLSGWISLQSSRVFSNTAVQKHQFFSTQLSLQSNFHIHIWNWKSHSFD